MKFVDFTTQYWNIRSYKNFGAVSIPWVLTLWHYDGNIFANMFQKHNGLWYDWIYVFGGSLKAKQYSIEILLHRPEGSSPLLYKDTVRSIDEKAQVIRMQKDCLVMDDSVVEYYMTNIDLPKERQIEGYDFRLPMHYRVFRSNDTNTLALT